MSGVGALAAQNDTDAVRDTTRQRLETLLASYGPARGMHFQRSGSEPFDIVGSYDTHLFYASRLEIIVTVTTKQTIGFRVYPYWRGAHINLNRVRRRSVLMQKLLRDADQSFFHWAVNPDRDVFAGFTFTLESGFPEDAIDMVIRSIPLLDRSVGELAPLIE
jgi:hypothetical protein